MRKILATVLFLLGALAVSAQNPQVPANTPLVDVNAKYNNGIGIGYQPTKGAALTLNLAPGTVNCSGTIHAYTGGTLTMADANANYVYLNGSSNCVPASSTSSSGFLSPNIPIAVVVAAGGVITTITDDRTMFFVGGTGGGGGVSSVGLLGPTGIVITNSPVTGTGTLTWAMPTGWVAGDLLLGNGSNSVARLPIGTNTFVLTSNGTTASWAAPTGASGCNPTGGDLAVQTNHPIGTCFGSGDFTWDDGNTALNLQAGNVNTITAGGSLDFAFGSHNTMGADSLLAFALGEQNTIDCFESCEALGDANIIGNGTGHASFSAAIGRQNNLGDVQNRSFAIGTQNVLGGDAVTHGNGPNDSILIGGGVSEGNTISATGASVACTHIYALGYLNSVAGTSTDCSDIVLLGRSNQALNDISDIHVLGAFNTIDTAVSTVAILGYFNAVSNASGNPSIGLATIVGASNTATSMTGLSLIAGNSETLSSCHDCYLYGANGTLSANSTLGIGMSATPEITITAGAVHFNTPTTIGATSFSDIVKRAAPANPASGNIRLYADSITGNLTCLTSTGGDCAPNQIALQTNATPNSTQTLLNVTQGSNITITEAAGVVTISGVAGSGTNNPGGTPNQIQYNVAGTSFGGFTMGGDCTTVVATGVITCTQTGGVPFVASATTDTTVATNITSGTLPVGRIPAAIPIGDIGSAGLSGTAPIAIASTGVISCANCVNATSPGAGIAHFAGSTQTVTSSAIDLSTGDVTGNLGVSHLNSGTGASGTTCWHGDATWAACGSGGGANLALSNLSGVAINTTLLSGTINTVDLGSNALPFRGLFLGTVANRALSISTSALSTNRIQSVQDVADTFVYRASTDIFTNKTFDTAGTGNVFKINGLTISSVSGTVGKVMTGTGTFTSGNCAKFDASGNIVDNGSGCSGGATFGWDGLTPATNSTGGSFISTGNTWDFSGVTQFLLRVGAGATSSGNGDIAYDTTAKNWHGFSNSVDNLVGIIPASITPSNNDCVKWTVSAGMFTLNTSGGVCGGAATIFQANGTPLTSSTTVNFQNSTAFHSLIASFSNPSAGNVKLGLSGSFDLAGLTAPSFANGSAVCSSSGAWTECAPSVVSRTIGGGTDTLTLTRGNQLGTFTNYTSNSAVAVSLTGATLNGQYANVEFDGSGAVTFTPTSGQVRLGAAALAGTLAITGPNVSCSVRSYDGVNFRFDCVTIQ